MTSNLSTIFYSSDILRIASYRRHGARPDFEAQDQITSGHLMVFPRTSVGIIHQDGESIIANPNGVTFYNLYDVFHRKKLSERGDCCEWFAFSPDVLLGAVRRFDPAVDDHPDQPFTLRSGPCDPASFLRQRMVVEHLANEDRPDRLFVEESMLGVLDEVLRNTYQPNKPGDPPARTHTWRQHNEIAHTVQEILSTSFDQEISLNQLSAQVYVSPYLLCRIFRQQTGITIHAYLNQLRLRTSLETVSRGCGRLTELAHSLGFSSHSHFTQAFRSLFGITPTEFHRRCCTALTTDNEQLHRNQTKQKTDSVYLHGTLPYFMSPNISSMIK